MNIDLYGFGPALAAGALVTVKLALSALCLGLVLGLLGALAKTSPSKPLQRLVRGSLGQGAEQTEHQAQAQRREGQLDGHQRASGERRAESVEIDIHGFLFKSQQALLRTGNRLRRCRSGTSVSIDAEREVLVVDLLVGAVRHDFFQGGVQLLANR